MESRSEIRTTAENETEPPLPKNPRFHLHMVQKSTEPSDRPIIQSSKWQRLAFYRAYSSTAIQLDLVALPHLKLNDFIWFYVLNIFMKSLPHGFLHFFMASYAPEEHIFLTKMVPICHGFKYLLIMSAFFEILLNTDCVILFFHYALDGIARRNPWNRCINATYYDEHIKGIMHCFDFEHVGDILQNRSNVYFDKFKFCYVTKGGMHFQSAGVEYYRLNVVETTHFTFIRDIVYFLIIWSAMAVYYRLVEKKIFWQMLHGIQWTITTFDLLTFLYLLSSEGHVHHDEDSHNDTTLPAPLEYGFFTLEYWAADVDILAESITSPAIVHILTARSTQEIHPGTDCASMVISNALLYLFKTLLFYEIKTYVESYAHTTLHFMDFCQRSWFFYWPIFYSHFYLGNIFTVMFMFFNAINEFFTLMVIYYCVIQTIIYEWPKLSASAKIWLIKGPWLVSGLLMMIFFNTLGRAILFIYSKAIVTLVESVFLYLLYPLGRFVDDYTFHYGSPPTRLRILNLRLVPVYYTFKFYCMMSAVFLVLNQPEVTALVPQFYWEWALMVVPLFLGVLWIIYKYLVKQRMTWQYIFRPVPKWGPRDFSERQLRKQYSSKYYISSEVPKLLSRYLMSKRESKVYKVDVRYDLQRRSTVSKAVGFSALKIDKKKI